MRKVYAGLVAVAVIVGILFLLTPAKLVNGAAEPALPDDLDAYLAANERRAADGFELIPGTEKRIRWQVPGERTEYVVIYLHGFSATRQEMAPVAERIAEKLGANLFETRLRGHGRTSEPLAEVTAEQWLEDGIEALAVGARLGDRIVLIGTSTGGTLAVALGGHDLMQAVDTIVLMSPNFGVHDPSSEWLTRPGGPLLARMMVGETRSWTPHNEQQGRYWSTTYPTASLIEMMRLVNYARTRIAEPFNQRVLMFYSPNDLVVSPAASRAAVEQMDATDKSFVEMEESGDPSNHVLAGNILSPETVEFVTTEVVNYVRPAGVSAAE